jgi:hypothetical protein
MRNLIIDDAAGGETKIRHDVTFSLLTLTSEKIRFKKNQICFAISPVVFARPRSLTWSNWLSLFG